VFLIQHLHIYDRIRHNSMPLYIPLLRWPCRSRNM